MEDLKNTIAAKLIYLRKKNNYTQTDLAEKLNYSDKAISKWENGESLPSIEILYEITKIYNVTLDYLVSEDTNLPLSEEEENLREEREKTAKLLKKRRAANHIIITLLSVIAVWFLALSLYVFSCLANYPPFWQVFLWAVPVSTIVAIIFNGIWGKRIYIFILASILLWSALACAYFQFMEYNMWVIFLLGIPVQTAIIVWANMK